MNIKPAAGTNVIKSNAMFTMSSPFNLPPKESFLYVFLDSVFMNGVNSLRILPALVTFEDSAKREEDVVDEHILHMRKLLKTSLEDLDLSVRAYNCLKAAKINSLGELVKFDTHELLKFRNFGKKSLVEIEELLTLKGLTFGMDLSKYKLDEE